MREDCIDLPALAQWLICLAGWKYFYEIEEEVGEEEEQEKEEEGVTIM